MEQKKYRKGHDWLTNLSVHDDKRRKCGGAVLQSDTVQLNVGQVESVPKIEINTSNWVWVWERSTAKTLNKADYVTEFKTKILYTKGKSLYLKPNHCIQKKKSLNPFISHLKLQSFAGFIVMKGCALW